MVKKVKAVKAFLEKKGWKHVRTRGDHWILRKDGEPRPIPIPGKPNDDLASGTLRQSFDKQALLKQIWKMIDFLVS